MDKLRRLMIERRGFIKEYLMTDRESWIYTTIGPINDITSVELSNVMEIPVRTASDLLSGIMKKGWLTRMEGIQSTGGKMFIYRQAN